jgi:hypothetical protein
VEFFWRLLKIAPIASTGRSSAATAESHFRQNDAGGGDRARIAANARRVHFIVRAPILKSSCADAARNAQEHRNVRNGAALAARGVGTGSHEKHGE